MKPAPSAPPTVAYPGPVPTNPRYAVRHRSPCPYVLRYVGGILSGLLFLGWGQLQAQPVRFGERMAGSTTFLSLANDQVEFRLVIDSGRIVSDRLTARPEWASRYGSQSIAIETDADFKMEIMWTGWHGPGYFNNAENPVYLRKSEFRIERHTVVELERGKKELILSLKGVDFPLLARLVYQLEPTSFHVRRKLAVADTGAAGHFLQKLWPSDCVASGELSVKKKGGFGQPVALRTGKGGGFFGLEYPAADNFSSVDAGGTRIGCSQEIGEKIGRDWLESEWAVEGLTPDSHLKQWFMKYLDGVRVAPLKPYTLYNSWYDLRSADYPNIREENVMNEANVMHIIDLVRTNMIEKHKIQLDAFVLDDGWDVYESDWVLRNKQFRNGLKPVADELKKTNTTLGMWFGPTGGYSLRMKRINWMQDHGYEVVGTTKSTAMLCLAGKKYSALFRKRVTDYVANDGVGYFKWDGIQFSCSEPDHGHPIGMYSRRAVMESLLEKCRSVREKNPSTYLNITSGTWLSPWWVKYANQIWMQGQDYGYADVPSISPRDAAMTYRDVVLYDDLTIKNQWFPIANLMTHGIIKGYLQMLGGQEEPLEKFTNEVLLYFARGVSMWELYISPGILTEGEWESMGEAMLWARDRFSTLVSTELVGGDPGKREPYAYVHFKGKKGIIAARNPWIEQRSLRVDLTSAYGLDPDASSLVLERVYPTRWISPQLFKSGRTVTLPLDGYELAVYELYPLSDAHAPLVAGATFDASKDERGAYVLSVHDATVGARLLNPDFVKGITSNGKPSTIGDVLKEVRRRAGPVAAPGTALALDKLRPDLLTSFTIDESASGASLAILLTPDGITRQEPAPEVLVHIDGKTDTARHEKSSGLSTWYSSNVEPGRHDVRIQITQKDSYVAWEGTASAWLIYKQKQLAVNVTFDVAKDVAVKPMPPRPCPPGIVIRNVKLGEVKVLKAK